MSVGRRYFLLPEALPKSEIPHMLGRVVQDKFRPLHCFAPFPILDSGGTPSISPEEIIPGILPEPVTWSSRSDFFSGASDWRVGTGLADLIGIEQSWSRENGVLIESDDVKSYAMPNTMQHFSALMRNDTYARDVRTLLKSSKTGHAYFVTGFLSAKSGTISQFKVKSRKTGLEVTAPVWDIAGVPMTAMGGIGNLQISPSVGTSQKVSQSRTMADEAIIAVSYDVIRSSRSLDLEGKHFMKKTIMNVGPKVAKPGHLAFSVGDDMALELDMDSEPIDYGDTVNLGPKRDLEDVITLEHTEMWSANRFRDGLDLDETATFCMPLNGLFPTS